MNAANTKTNLLKNLFRPFVSGVMALLPIGLTVAVVAWLASIVRDLVGPGSAFGNLLKQIGWDTGRSETGAYLVGIALAVMLIYVFGFCVEAGLKSRWQRLR